MGSFLQKEFPDGDSPLPDPFLAWREDSPPPLAAGEVHVWRLSLDSPADEAGGEALLSPGERERASRLSDPGARRRHVLCRAALRRLLGGYLRVPPAGIDIGVGPKGKPFIPGAPVEFNLSHSGAAALIACAAGMAVGVDIESTDRRVDMAGIAARFFTASERTGWEEEHRRAGTFFKVWTRKEAVLKAHGGGLSGGVSELEVAGWLPGGAGAIWLPRIAWDGVSFDLHDLPTGPGNAGALAVAGAVERLRLFSL